MANFTITTAQWEQGYKLVNDLALKAAYYRKGSRRHEEMLDAGMNALMKVATTYTEGKGTAFQSYLFGCIENALADRHGYCETHDLPEQDDYDFTRYCDEVDEIRQGRIVEETKKLIRIKVEQIYTHNVGEERKDRACRMVAMNLGLEDEPLNCRELAEEFGISAEGVRKICNAVIKALREDKNCVRIIRENVD